LRQIETQGINLSDIATLTVNVTLLRLDNLWVIECVQRFPTNSTMPQSATASIGI
jgi:hypothetical protein